ncbi:hypothetical protein L1887_54822 [Cichorium endivia]|nr:hypothetical protein L1887_54822 [Cichorium endivia]
MRMAQPRRLSTQPQHPAPTAAYPPELFQDIVHRSLRSMLSPRDVKPGSTTPCWTAQDIDAAPATALQAKTGKARASASPTLNTSMLILRLIRNNRILSAMTAFTEHMNTSSLPPFTHDQLEAFIVALRIQSRRHASARPTPKQQAAAVHAELWRPSRLDPSISAKSLPIPVQCMYAMSAVYDVSIEQKHRPTAKMVSAMLATFATTLAPEQLLQAAHTAIQHLFPRHHHVSAQARCLLALHQPPRTLNLHSRVWARRRARRGRRVPADSGPELSAPSRHSSRMQPCCKPTSPSTWPDGGGNIVVWQSLINARVDAGHLAEARKWLDSRTSPTWPACATRPGICARSDTSVASSRPPTTSCALMAADHVPIESSVLAFVLDCDARLGHVDGGASLLHELGDLIHTMALADPALLRSLLHMRRAVVDNTSSAGARSHLSNLASTRSLIRSLVRVGEGETPASRDHIAECRSRGMLNDALITVMAERDYPAAVAVLNLFERWMITVSQTTYSIVLTSLIAHGPSRRAAWRSSPGDALRQRIQPRGDAAEHGARGQRRAGAHYPQSAWRPGAPFRHIPRLRSARNAAEEDAVPGAHPQPRLRGRDRGGREPRATARVGGACDGDADAALERRRARCGGQGPSLERKPGCWGTRTRASSASPHLTAAPATWSRELSTSAAARQTAAPSCDLAASAKGDYTHLEPVRTVYIPGFVPYDLGLALQEHLVQERAQARQALRALDDASSTSASVRAGLTLVSASASEAALRAQAAQDTLLLLQHRPVYTEGRREESENFDVAEALRALGADYKLTKRGGQITYHGPGKSMTCVHDRLDPTGPFARYNSGQQGDKDESVESVASDYVRHFANVFKRTTRQATQEEMSFELAPEDKAAVMRQRLGIHVAHDEQVVQAIRVGHHRVQRSSGGGKVILSGSDACGISGWKLQARLTCAQSYMACPAPTQEDERVQRTTRPSPQVAQVAHCHQTGCWHCQLFTPDCLVGSGFKSLASYRHFFSSPVCIYPCRRHTIASPYAML